MSSKYRKFGLRRDKNLSDVLNGEAALGNLLNGLAVGNETFEPKDIYVINGIRNSAVRNEDFRQLGGTVRSFTPLEGGSSQPIRPLITVQDHIDNYKSILGDLPFIGGGDGPNAYFAASVLLNDQATIASAGEANTLTGDDIFDTASPAVIGPEDFWENGNFVFGDKIYPTFADGYGAIQWVGYLSSIQALRFESTGLFLIEQDVNGDDNWETLKSVYDADRTVTVVSAAFSGTNTTITVSEDDIKKVCIGDTMEFGGLFYSVLTVSNAGLSFQVSGNLTGTMAPGNVLPISFNINQSELLDSNTLFPFVPFSYDTLRVRFTLWWPIRLSGANYPDKTFWAIGNSAGNGSESLPFNFLYSAPNDNTTEETYTFKYFIEERLSPTQQRLDDAFIQTTESFLIPYTPDTSFANNVLSAGSIVVGGRGRFEIAPTGSISFADAQVGDWIIYRVSATDSRAAQIIEKVSNSVVYANADIHTVSVATPVLAAIVKNRGLVGIYYYSPVTFRIHEVGGESTPVNEVKIDNMFSGINLSNLSRNTFMKQITSRGTVDGNNTMFISGRVFVPGDVTGLVTSPNLTDSIFVVYAHSGLSDYSGEQQCFGVYGRELVQQANVGTQTLVLASSFGVAVGDYIQFGNPNNYVAVTTTVTQVVNGTTITISAPLLATIPQNATIIFIQSAQGDPGLTSKEFCVLPLNTAPPFFSTSTGLSTSLNFPNLDVNDLAFKGLELKSMPTATLNETTLADTGYTQYLPIEYNGTIYKMLIK